MEENLGHGKTDHARHRPAHSKNKRMGIIRPRARGAPGLHFMDNAKKNKWFIAIKEREPHFLKDGYVGPDGVKIIEPAEGTYHADPFLFRNLIFFELYDYEKGVIACMDKDGKNMKLVL